ncbi:MAG: prepilin peptidase, partial [Verrucomicrobiota bacterium]
MKFIDLPTFLSLLVTALGATVGSFLKLCIYSKPPGLTVKKPRRYICPASNKHITIKKKNTIASWLL